MFVRRLVALGAVLVILALAALGAPRPSPSASHEQRYVVESGDTLWQIADAHYDGDPREAIWRIKQRNGLRTSSLYPGMVLALPP